MSTQPTQVAAVNPTAATPRPAGAAVEQLNADQMRLLHMLAKGLTHDQMAARVGCHSGTVRQRLHRAYLALGANNGPHAVAIAIRAGLLPESRR